MKETDNVYEYLFQKKGLLRDLCQKIVLNN